MTHHVLHDDQMNLAHHHQTTPRLVSWNWKKVVCRYWGRVWSERRSKEQNIRIRHNLHNVKQCPKLTRLNKGNLDFKSTATRWSTPKVIKKLRLVAELKICKKSLTQSVVCSWKIAKNGILILWLRWRPGSNSRCRYWAVKLEAILRNFDSTDTNPQNCSPGSSSVRPTIKICLVTQTSAWEAITTHFGRCNQLRTCRFTSFCKWPPHEQSLFQSPVQWHAH